MKNILMIVSLFMVMIFLVSCTEEPKKYQVVKTGTETTAATSINSNDISIIGETSIQGCEYFVVHTYYYNIPIHKGNCKNSIHRMMCDSNKFIQRIEKDSLKIRLLEMKLEVSEKMSAHLLNRKAK